MTRSSSKAALERLGSVRDVARSPSGSKEALVLRRGEGALRPVDAARALAFCGISLLKAKRAVEAALEGGEAALILPRVPDARALADRLGAAGFVAHITTSATPPDLKALREGLGLTQEQFAVIYGLDLKTVQNYESGARRPDRTAISYLRAIERAPEAIKRARLAG